jgi:hypothetical protein
MLTASQARCTRAHKYTPRHMHTCTQVHMHAGTCTRAHTCTRMHTCSQAHCTRAHRLHTRAHTGTCTMMRTCTHVHTHMHSDAAHMPTSTLHVCAQVYTSCPWASLATGAGSRALFGDQVVCKILNNLGRSKRCTICQCTNCEASCHLYIAAPWEHCSHPNPSTRREKERRDS